MKIAILCFSILFASTSSSQIFDGGSDTPIPVAQVISGGDASPMYLAQVISGNPSPMLLAQVVTEGGNGWRRHIAQVDTGGRNTSSAHAIAHGAGIGPGFTDFAEPRLYQGDLDPVTALPILRPIKGHELLDRCDSFTL
jgi:hypothetical protein